MKAESALLSLGFLLGWLEYSIDYRIFMNAADALIRHGYWHLWVSAGPTCFYAINFRV